MSRIVWSQSAVLTADTALKAVAGRVKSIFVSWKDAAAGEFVALANHGTDSTPVGIPPIVFDGANGCKYVEFADPGIEFDTGIFFNKGPSAGSSVKAIVQYR